MINDFFNNIIHWSVKCTLYKYDLRKILLQEVEWFHSLRKGKNESGTWRWSVLYLPRKLPLVRVCVCSLWLQASGRVLEFIWCVCLCVCVQVWLRWAYCVEFRRVDFVEDCIKCCVANPMVCNVNTLFNVQQMNMFLLIFVKTFYI